VAVLKDNPSVIIPGVEGASSPKPLVRATDGERNGSAIEPPPSPSPSPRSAPSMPSQNIVPSGTVNQTVNPGAGTHPNGPPKKRGRSPKFYGENGVVIKRPVERPRKSTNDGPALSQPAEVRQQDEATGSANNIDVITEPQAGAGAGPGSNQHEARLAIQTDRSSGGSGSDPANSITPAADFLKLIGARQKSLLVPPRSSSAALDPGIAMNEPTSTAATPVASQSQSPRKTIHLSSGKTSEAHLRQKDVQTPTKVDVKKAKPVKTDSVKAAAAANVESLRIPIHTGRASSLTSSLPTGFIPDVGDLSRYREKSSNGVGRNREAPPIDEDDQSLHHPPSGPSLFRHEDFEHSTLAAPAPSASRIRSPSVVITSQSRPAPLDLLKKKALNPFPSIVLISTPRKRMIPVVELPSPRKIWEITKVKPIRPPMDRAKVVLDVSRRRRRLLIQRGHYGMSSFPYSR